MLEEVEKYRTMKEELRHKHVPGGSFTAIDEETKKRTDKARLRASPRLVHQKTRGFRISVSLSCICGCESVAGSKIADPTEPSAPPPYE